MINHSKKVLQFLETGLYFFVIGWLMITSVYFTTSRYFPLLNFQIALGVLLLLTVTLGLLIRSSMLPVLAKQIIQNFLFCSLLGSIFLFTNYFIQNHYFPGVDFKGLLYLGAIILLVGFFIFGLCAFLGATAVLLYVIPLYLIPLMSRFISRFIPHIKLSLPSDFISETKKETTVEDKSLFLRKEVLFATFGIFLGTFIANEGFMTYLNLAAIKDSSVVVNQVGCKLLKAQGFKLACEQEQPLYEVEKVNILWRIGEYYLQSTTNPLIKARLPANLVYSFDMENSNN